MLDWFQCRPQHGTHLVRLGFWFSRIGSRTTPLSVAVFAPCWAGNAWWFCCALQGLFFQCASHRYLHCFDLLCRRRGAIASLINGPQPVAASLPLRDDQFGAATTPTMLGCKDV